jgi:hypothetical protein
MGWQDREYNAGREELGAYFANPSSLLRLSVPVYHSPRFYVRLHFWFLVFALFRAIYVLRVGMPVFYIPVDIAVMLAATLLHETGHRFFARRVGGNHWEWVLWPLGGMVAPTCPRNPWSVFVANGGGLFISIPLGIAAYAALRLIPHAEVQAVWMLDPLAPFLVSATIKSSALAATGVHALGYFCEVSATIVIINLFPAYWFDGGPIWQAILWPKFGAWKATLITCTAGFILGIACLILTLWQMDLLGLIIWALIISDCFNRKRALKSAGPGVMDEDEVSYNYMDTPEPHSRKKRKKHWFNQARKRALADQAEQAKIDSILAKVKEQGLHSLTWWEKRTLKKATARQRERDLAGRM